nr:DNA mismatch repair endonuclease MutL [uncultured Porphyromonas sp.]
MSEIIHLLPDSIANQIAAGEVIQRPASMLKELVENAIDAHATQITIELQDAGKELMRVIDDGVGMSPLDARMAFERHATSKISSVDDLFTLRSMGFRGEALASIVAVAQIELVTRQADSEIGYKLLINGSEVVSSSPTVAEIGTSITVKNLFYNVPARRRFLKGSETELRHIYRQFERIALVYPEIAFTLYSEGKLIRNLPKSDLQHRIVDLLGKSYSKQLIPIEYQGPLANVSGFITLPRDAKRRGAQQFFFVNGRYMKHPYFHRAVMNVFEDLVAPGSQPNYFIYFQVDPSRIDVNIHPTKTEIKFLDEQAIFKLLMVVLREHLSTTSAMPAITFSTDQLIEIPAYDATRQSSTALQPPPVQIDPEYNPFKAIPTDEQRPTDPLSSMSSGSPPPPGRLFDHRV